MAFAELEPFGFQADIYGHAITASTIANVNRKKGAKPFEPRDFIPAEVKTAKENKSSFVKSLKDFMFRTKQNRKDK